MKYKIGDWVKVVRLSPKQKGCDHKVGFVGKIESVNDRKSSFLCSLTDYHDVWDWDDIVPCCQHGAVEGDACTSCSASVHPSKKFKVGDRVKYTSGRHGWGEFNPRDKIGTIFEFSGLGYRVDWGSGKKNSYYEGDLEKIEEPLLSVKEIRKAVKILKNYSYPQADYYPIKFGADAFGVSLKKGTFMQKLSNLPQAIRRAFDKDQKALYRAGYIDQHGKWTPKAKDEADDEIQEKFLNENKAEFVSRAEEAIALAKEEKCDEECD